MGLNFTPELLIVDDRIENLKLLQALLEGMDVKLALFQSPLEALQEIDKKEYALILLDIQMPKMDGFLLAQKIRQGKVNSSTPIVFLTGVYLDKKSEQKGYECGCVDFIMKPFNSSILKNKVNIFLDLYRNKRQKEFQNSELITSLRDKELLEGRLRFLATNYRTILEGQSELILKINSSQIIEFANKAFSDFFNYSLDGISKNNVSDISNDFAKLLKTSIEEMNGRKQFVIAEKPIINQLNELKWFEWSVFKDVDLDDVHYLIVGRDVSEKKLLRDSLLKKEMMMRETEKLTQVGSFEWDSYSEIFKGSEEFYKLYEITNKEIEKVQDLLDLTIHPEDVLPLKRMFDNLPKKNQKLEFEHRVVCNNDNIRHLHVELYCEYNSTSDVVNLHGFVFNISKDKDLEESFKKSLSLQKDAYHDKTFLELNEKNEIIYINDFGCDFLECQDIKNTNGVSFLNFIPDKEKDRVESIFNLKRRKKGFVFEVITIKTYQQKLKKVVVGAYSAVNKNQIIVRVIIHCLYEIDSIVNNPDDYKDMILALKRKEKEFTQRNEKLSNRVDKELKVNEFQGQLLYKKSELESLGKMARSVVHEINQPLTGISMVMDNLLLRLSMDKIDEEYIREKCSQVFNDIDRIKTFLSQIGIFNSSQKEDRNYSVNVNDVVKNAIDMVQKQYRNSKVNVKLDTDNKRLFIYGNKYKLEKVIIDILNNSYESVCEKYKSLNGKQTEKLIHISTELSDDKVVVVIKDNGFGIDPENLNYIFEPFFSTKQEGIRSGLGLYVSKNIVQKMNGKISVNSKKNEFTEMKLIFPYEMNLEKEMYFK
ncbi:response regulator [Marinifilum sp. RC60d5]|uniref:response regulator n=1 Tax=Marinifilum sp. RC60d5 TaxID=3458414 RepID=UPI004037030E